MGPFKGHLQEEKIAPRDPKDKLAEIKQSYFNDSKVSKILDFTQPSLIYSNISWG